MSNDAPVSPSVPTNMYGCTPCPKCKSVYRWPTQAVHPTDPNTILCDDCNFKEPINDE